LFNFASKANVRAALHRSLYWSKSLVIGMTEEHAENLLYVIEEQRLGFLSRVLLMTCWASVDLVE